MKKVVLIFIALILNANYAWGAIVTSNTPNNCAFLDNSVTATAVFEPNEYTCANGYYLPANHTGCELCPNEHTCNGGTFNFNENIAQGIVYNHGATSDIQYGCDQRIQKMSAMFEPNQHTCSAGYFLPANTDGCATCLYAHTCAGGTYSFNENVDQGIVINSYTCSSGEYLPADTLGCETCPRGHTCAGGTFNYNANDDQGIVINTYTCSSGQYLPANGLACETCPTGHTCAGGTFTFNAKDFQGLVLDTDSPIPANTNVCAENLSSSLIAIYDLAEYTCSSGQYLPADGVACESCPTGYACPGGTFTFDTTTDQGIHKFALTTTNLTANATFDFNISASGTFTVDCGDGGTLTSSADPSDVSGYTITRSNTTETTYTCTYSTGGEKTISFDGTATGYNSEIVAAIRYNISDNDNDTNAQKIASISGNLSTIFPALSNNRNPKFYRTFRGAQNLTSIPSTLFNGYTAGSSKLFDSTFMRSGVTSIPPNLFANITTGGAGMFDSTFLGCTGLTEIPSGLFTNITTGVWNMFQSTFHSCTNLQTIPANLFAGITNRAQRMFIYTFYYCSSLREIPATLFSNITTGAEGLFWATFAYTNLTSIPANLFSNITTGAENMFNSTFSQCPLLSGYVPPTLFAGLITNNVEYATNMMHSMFNNTNLATSCDSYTGTVRYYTPYDEYWSSKVMCGVPINCDPGKYLTANATTCTTCPTNNYCTGGGYGFNYSSDQGITHCSGDLRAPQGMWESQQCGRRFNVGGKYVYSRSTRKTSPSINLDMDLNGTTEFYISLSKIPVPMNVDFANLSQHNKLVIDLPKAYVNSVGVNVPAGKYYAYDDTMTYDLSTLDYTISPTSYGVETSTKTWQLESSYGVISGEALCSVTAGSGMYKVGTPDETTPNGQNCWCKVTRYTPDGSNITYLPRSPNTWVYHTISGGFAGESCENVCVQVCGYRSKYEDFFRHALFGQANN